LWALSINQKKITKKTLFLSTSPIIVSHENQQKKSKKKKKKKSLFCILPFSLHKPPPHLNLIPHYISLHSCDQQLKEIGSNRERNLKTWSQTKNSLIFLHSSKKFNLTQNLTKSRISFFKPSSNHSSNSNNITKSS
jgi:hypothetical protein